MKFWFWFAVSCIAIPAFAYFCLYEYSGHLLHTCILWMPVLGAVALIAGRSVIRNDWSTASAKDKQVFRQHSIAAIICVAMVVILAAVGFWNPESPRYWRHPAQTALFFGARYAPSSYVARITLQALTIHPAGITYSETEEAAQLLERVGEATKSSPLWLSLVKFDLESGYVSQAIHHATLSQKATSNLGALEALVALTEKSSSARSHWIAELKAKYPSHEFSNAFLCLEQIKSFDNVIPATCGMVAWVNQKAIAGRDQYQQISQQIKELPKEVARNIKDNEREIAEYREGQATFENYDQANAAEIDRLNSAGWLEAAIRAIINMLPLPQPGDTFERWLAREGICALPYARIICRADDISKAVFEVQQRKQQLVQERSELQAQLGRYKSLINYCNSQIEYWRSSEPMEELVSSRNKLIPTFQSEIEANIAGRRQQLGISVPEAIAVAAGQNDR